MHAHACMHACMCVCKLYTRLRMHACTLLRVHVCMYACERAGSSCAHHMSLACSKAAFAMVQTRTYGTHTQANKHPRTRARTCDGLHCSRSDPFMCIHVSPQMCMCTLGLGVLGLGDSNLLLDRQTTTAKDCNQCAQSLDARLEALGATRHVPLGMADERTGLAEVCSSCTRACPRACVCAYVQVEPWIEGLVTCVK